MGKTMASWLRRKARTINQSLCALNSRYWPGLSLSQPYSAMIEVSTVCNLHCGLCPVGRGKLGRPAEFMPLETFTRIIDQFNPMFVETIYPAMWGESLLHPQFVDMLEYVQRKKADYTVVVNTNGNLDLAHLDMRRLVRSGLGEVIVALDGHEEDCYRRYREGGNFEKLRAFTSALAEEKAKAGIGPKVTGLVILSRFNEDQVSEIQQLFGPYLDAFQTKRMRVFMDHSHKTEFEARLLDLQPRDAEKCYNSTGTGQETEPVCRSFIDGIYVNVRGELIACCGDPSNNFRFGSLLEHDLGQLRNSAQFQKFKARLIKNPKGLPQCRACLFKG